MKKNWWHEKVIVGGKELTRLQLEVLRLNAKGLDLDEIARELGCSLSYVTKFLTPNNKDSALKAIGVQNKRKALLWSQQNDVQVGDEQLINLRALYLDGVNARLEGRTDIALQFQTHLCQVIEGYLNQVSAPTLVTELKRLRLLSLLERIRGLQDKYPPPVILQTNFLLHQATALAKALRIRELAGAVHLLRGEILYIDGDFVSAHNEIHLAEGLVTEVGHRLWVLRFKGLSLAYFQNKMAFLQLEPELYDLIHKGREMGLNSAFGALEGLGRAQGLLGLDRSLITLNQEWVSLAQALALSETAFLRRIQVVRSRLEVARLFGLGVDMQATKDLEMGLRFAREGGYERYVYLLTSLFPSLALFE